jgi:hypothetical protein
MSVKVNFQDIAPGELEMIEQSQLESVPFLVYKTNGQRGYFNLSKLMKWVRENGTDPINPREAFNWDNYRAVNWIHNENLPSYLHRQYNPRATERILKLLKNGVIGQPYDERREREYVQFRILMTESVNANLFHQIDWLNDYWTFHPYSPHHDADIIGLRLPDEYKRHSIDNNTMLIDFRMSMRQRLNDARDHLVARYWANHPITIADPDFVRENYESSI